MLHPPDSALHVRFPPAETVLPDTGYTCRIPLVRAGRLWNCSDWWWFHVLHRVQHDGAKPGVWQIAGGVHSARVEKKWHEFTYALNCFWNIAKWSFKRSYFSYQSLVRCSQLLICCFQLIVCCFQFHNCCFQSPETLLDRVCLKRL